jgi:hypothetical protein
MIWCYSALIFLGGALTTSGPITSIMNKLTVYATKAIVKPVIPKYFTDATSSTKKSVIATILKIIDQNWFILTFASHILQRVDQNIKGNSEIPFSLQFGHFLFIVFISSNVYVMRRSV